MLANWTNGWLSDQELAKGMEFHRAGRLAEAIARYRLILSVIPAHPDAWHLLGLATHQQGGLDAAVALIRRAITINDKPPVYHWNSGIVLSAAGLHRQAIESFAVAAALQPGGLDANGDAVAGAYLGFGNSLNRQGSPAEAVIIYRMAICLQPAYPAAWNNMGAALKDLRRPNEAVAAYGKAIRGVPAYAQAHSNLGYAFHDQGKFTEAVAAYETSLRYRPDSAVAHNNLGHTYEVLGKLEKGRAACVAALVIDPAFMEAHNNLGNILQQLRLSDRALAAFGAAIAINPGYSEAHNNKGNALREQARFSEAIESYRAAVRIDPDASDLRSNLILALHYQHYDGGAIFDEARTYGARLEKNAVPLHAAGDRNPARRLRIGYVSGDFYSHPVGRFLFGVLKHHDPMAVEIFCYSNGPAADDLTERLRGLASHWRTLIGVTDRAAAEMIASDGIDILVDLSGHTAHNRLPVFAVKPAPIQATWLGYWGTTGLPQVDYLITDEATVPVGTEGLYTETVMRLPKCRFTYEAPDYVPLPASLPSPDIVFGSFNNLAKVGPETIAIWSHVLREVPGSKLLLKWQTLGDEQVRRRIVAAFVAAGVDDRRLILRGASSHQAMLGEYGEIDIALDPTPFSGGLTSCEALWMGVPVVTLAGKGPQSRQTYGFLRSLGLLEWTAQTPDEYVKAAVSLASHGKRSTQSRLELRNRMASSSLCDSAEFTRDLEAGYRTMWRQWCGDEG